MKLLISWSVAALAALLWTPALGASILLSAEDFALLGGTAITSTGAVGTVISNGNVGLSPGATTGITGFPPAAILGGAIVATGPVTGQARLDLITVRTGLANMPSNTNLSNVDLGGMTLFSGVYTFNAAATLNGALVLDGQGQNGAFWVFQIGTSFTGSVDSSVTVINPGSNGGSDYGIFWNAGSEIIIGANNALLGNYLSGTSVTLGAQSGGSGRVLVLAAVTLDQNALNAYGGPGGNDWTGGLKYDPQGNVIPLPEPSTAVLIGLPIAGLLLMRRLRR
jgi:hypothetical protein